MSHLLAIAVGPVQEFIAAARRTRDLWFGSYLLSEISKAVASSVKDQGGKLIFPHPDTDLTSGDNKVNVANVILTELPTGNPKEVAKQAKEAAKECWKRFAEEAHQAASGAIRPKLAHEEKSIWDEQVDDVIEFYAAWVARNDPNQYAEDRKKLMRLLAGRKNCRDFLPAKGRAGVPKSSLDGQRESVLKDPARERWPERFRARLRIREGEQLDVIGLVKRVAGGTQLYPSVSRIAADPWVRGNRHRTQFRELLTVCSELPAHVLHHLGEAAFPQFQDFPYEGTAVYVSRHHEWEEEISDEDQVSLSFLHDTLSEFNEPNPYLAVLVADGDKMGAAISALTSPDANRKFSQALVGFATEARKIVEGYEDEKTKKFVEGHNGVLVYAGGDDVLAFLPVDKCLGCARALREKFIECLKTQVPNDTPTLSVGIAIGHFMENLEDLLNYGREAEKAAKKPDRDGLAVHLHKRGGAPIGVRARWSSGSDNRIVLHKGTPREREFNLQKFDERLLCFAQLILAEAIPGKLPYDLRQLAEHYKGWRSDQQVIAEAMRSDVLRVIRDKQPRSGKQYMTSIEEISKALVDIADLERFTEQLLVARQIATALRQTAGRSVAAEEVMS